MIDATYLQASTQINVLRLIKLEDNRIPQICVYKGLEPRYWQTPKASLQQSLRKARLRATKKYDFDEATQSKMQVAWVRNINAQPKFMVGKQISFK